MHNESMADRIVDGTAEEIGNSNNGSEPRGVSKVTIEFPTKYIYGGVALVVGLVVGRKLNLLGAKAAPVLQEAANKVEEVAE